MGDQIPIVPLPRTDGEIRVAFLNGAQAMTSQANVVTSQVQAMTTQMNREVGTHGPHHASTTTSHLETLQE